MLTSEFQTLFYPEEGVVVPKTGTDDTLPRALLVPHAAFRSVGEDLFTGYQTISACEPKLVVVLSSLHSENLAEDDGMTLFVPEDDGMTICGKNVTFDTSPLEGNPFAKKRNSYFKEEASIEVQLPCIQNLFPLVPILPIFVTRKMGSKEVRIVSSLLGKIIGKEKDTLVVVSSNASSFAPSAESYRKAVAFSSSITSGTPLLDQAHKGTIDACGSGILDAVTRQEWSGGRWDILSVSAHGWRAKGFPPEAPEGKEQMVWHVTAVTKGV